MFSGMSWRRRLARITAGAWSPPATLAWSRLNCALDARTTTSRLLDVAAGETLVCSLEPVLLAAVRAHYAGRVALLNLDKFGCTAIRARHRRLLYKLRCA
jgi:hypothetical protein